MKRYPSHNAATHTLAFLIGFCTLSSDALAQPTPLICGGRQTVSYIGDLVQDFTIPTVDPPQFIRLRAEGADGGWAKAGTNDHCESLGGRGAKATALFKVGSPGGQLSPGGTLRFIIGDSGETDNGRPSRASQGAGGGGSAVLYLRPNGQSHEWKILVVGGGGGGAHQAVALKVCVDSHDGDDGQRGECGSDGGDHNEPAGGCGGGRGESKIALNGDLIGGGGGGSSQSADQGGLRGHSNGGDGGDGDQVGGWGYGGGGGAVTSGGGGGGYSGGGAGDDDFSSGGGGGSYINELVFNGVGGITTGDRSQSNGSGFYECIDDNEDCANAFVILDSPSGIIPSAIGVIDETTTSTDGSSSCESPPSPDRWYVYTATCDSTVTVRIDDFVQLSEYNLAVFDDCGGTELDCDTGTFDPSHRAEITWTMLAGETHLIRISNSGQPSAYGLLVTSVPIAPGNDNAASPEAMGLGQTVRAELCGATNDGTSTCAPGERDVWFSYTSGDCDQTIRLNSLRFVGSSFAVYNPGGQEIECQDNPWDFVIPDFFDFPAMTWAQPANTTYTIRASSDTADALTFAITQSGITDTDGDEVCDGTDNCPDHSNADQLDSDGPNSALSPVAAWRFDENTGTTTTDVVAGHVGTLNTVIWNASGYRGSALRFPVGGSTVGVPASTDFDITDHLTIALWVRPFGFPVSVNRLVTRPNENYVFRLQGQKPHFYVKKGGVTTGSRASMQINANEWTHLAAVWDGAGDGVLRIFVNGIEVPAYDTHGSVSLPLDTFGTGISLGNGGSERFEGLMDELVIYDHALSDAEVLELFNLGFGDGTGDICDPCPIDNPDDTDGDGVCDSVDICQGDNASGDTDGDGTCDDIDVCVGDDASGDSDGDGVCDDMDTCPNSPNAHNITQGSFHATILDAISNASRLDVIELGACTFNEWGFILSNKDITIRGQGRDHTIIDAGYNGRVFRMQAGDDSNIEDLTIRRGVPVKANGGAAVQVYHDCSPTFRNCDFRECDGTGFSKNVVDSVGTNSFMLFESCRFLDNFGGGNSSAYGGFSTARFVNCLFAGNSGANRTIGTAGTLEVVSCTFVDNANARGVSGSGATVTNCVFDGSNPDSSVGGGATATSSLFPGASVGNIDGVPTFEDPVGGDYRLAAGSLGIDAADHDAYVNASGGATDLNEDPRLHADPGTPDTGSGLPTYLDMGAYEFQGTTPRPGDCDGNGIVDLSDYDGFATCLLGPGGGLGTGCECFDFDNDNDVDHRDFATFANEFTGPD